MLCGKEYTNRCEGINAEFVVYISGGGESDRFATSFRVIGDVVYKVWYVLNNELWLVPCGRDAAFAWRLIVAYLCMPSLFPWLEFEKGEGCNCRQ